MVVIHVVAKEKFLCKGSGRGKGAQREPEDQRASWLSVGTSPIELVLAATCLNLHRDKSFVLIIWRSTGNRSIYRHRP